MHTDDFDYKLPAELIAQTPVEPRDASRLMVLDRTTATITHDHFYNIGRYLQHGDLVVANESRVIPARLWGRKATGGRVELLLLRRRDDRTWEALVGGKGVRPGTTLVIEPRDEGGSMTSVEVLEMLPHGGRLIRFETQVEAELPHLGVMPLPPYIHEQLDDQERYQTVYSRTQGSAAAPTAGLHFTPQLIAQLQSQGVTWTTVTLHVGLDTFRPVQVNDPEQHQMHSEWFELPLNTAMAINAAKAEGRRVVAVGTTTARVLETAAQWAERDGQAQLGPCTGDTNIFIYPPYRFQVVDALVTNFHLPKSTLLMMVSAFAGRDQILAAYNEAVVEKYRFFSFGDAMLLV